MSGDGRRSKYLKVSTDLDWQVQAACLDADPELFFHPDNERGENRRARTQAAKAVCARCPVLAQCRADVLVNQPEYGTWGGLSEDERRLVKGKVA